LPERDLFGAPHPLLDQVRRARLVPHFVGEIDTARRRPTVPIPKKGWSPGAGIAGAPSNLIQHEL
jgi:hypothetical protein